MSWLKRVWYYWHQRKHYVAVGNLPLWQACRAASARGRGTPPHVTISWAGASDDY